MQTNNQNKARDKIINIGLIITIIIVALSLFLGLIWLILMVLLSLVMGGLSEVTLSEYILNVLSSYSETLVKFKLVTPIIISGSLAVILMTLKMIFKNQKKGK